MAKKQTLQEINWRNVHKDMTKEGLELSFKVNREYTLAKDQYTTTPNDNYLSLALTIRDRIVERWIETQQRYHKKNLKRVYYLSMEFLIGRLLGNFVYNFGFEKEVKAALSEMGFDFDKLSELEMDAGLGNGGLGRLAACFLESMASLNIPAHGYGIRYDYGIFKQKIQNGYQIELPDEWLRLGSPWEIARPEYTFLVRFYGNAESYKDDKGKDRVKWVNTENITAVPYDIPVLGYRNNVVNTLRLWSARSTEDFDLDYFNDGDYERAVYKKILSENISKVLYPNDSQSQGRELRLKQEYFFTAASISDIIRRYKSENSDITKLPDKVAIQLNDTHPALGIVELMRILLDDHNLAWGVAWDVTKKVFAYTNHTLMPEALECWSADLLGKVLPRHLQIIYDINAKFLEEVYRKYPEDHDKVRRMSIIEEGFPKKARMAYLAIAGSHSVNGVSRLHTDLLKSHLFKDFNEFYPKKFNNKTNGITQRQWLLKSNTALSELIIKTIGDKWPVNLDLLQGLKKYAEDKSFQKKWAEIKMLNKKTFSEYLSSHMSINVDPETMFDVQVKRIHEYKRQLLFTFYVISQYLVLKNDPKKFIQPRTFFIGGKAAPGYAMAKLIIKFINNVSDTINNDKDIKGKIRLFFLENYRVSLAEKIFPASELSEQISTAGTEASGTGNMKFMLNGALTIGTLDGANVEMAEQLNNKDIFIFGLKDPEVIKLKSEGYHPQRFIDQFHMLREIKNLIGSNFFSKNEHGIFDPILNNIFQYDPFLVCADFESYCKMQDVVSNEYKNKEEWNRKSIMNVASSGWFSSDRTIREYAKEIWNIPTE